MPKHTRVIALGGTFDHFHVGHQHFLKFAADLGGSLLIGVTTERMTQHKPFSKTIQPFGVRKRSVLTFCQKNNIRCQIIPLDDPYGTSVSDKDIFGLALTEMTVKGGQEINVLRQKLRLRPLETVVCTMLRDSSGEVISSSRIRAGEINRDGVIFKNLFSKPLVLDADQKAFFSQPQGELVDRFANMYPSPRTCVVGDMSLATFLKFNDRFNLAVYDQKQQRQPLADEEIKKQTPDFTVKNPAGEISTELVKTLTQALQQKKRLIKVEGEEDLAAVALVLLLPLESFVYYGQPDQGMVAMHVTEGLKDTFYKILSH